MYVTIVILPCRDRKIKDISDAEEDTEEEGDNFWYLLGFLGLIFFHAPLIFFLQAKDWLNTKQIIAKIKRVFLNMSKR